MTECPPDIYLRNVIDGATAPAVESHLDACQRCCARLDELSGVAAVGDILKSDRSTDSPALRTAIARLEAAHESSLSFGRPRPADLPPLGPASRPGSMGSLKGIDLLRVIGRGGMGVVYEGYDPALDRKVAVKLLSSYLARDAESRERFLREGRAAAAIAHDNVVAIHAIDQSGELPFLVLQLVEGESLADLLKREGALPAERAAAIGAAVARGLAAAHAKGMVHRDIKPANVLIERDTGTVRLTDFGLAKVAGSPNLTAAGVIAGTAAYMSPEQAVGRPLDARADLFSLGVLLYAAVAGRLPFVDDSPFVVLHKICHDAPPPLASTVPEWFRAIVFRLLEKEPKRRYSSASEVADALERRTAVPIPKRRAWVWPAVGLVAVFAAAVGAHLIPPSEMPSVPVIDPAKPGSGPQTGEPAKPVDVIELTGDGPHVLPKVAAGKSLSIRAAAGSKPRVAAATFDGDLTFDGVVLEGITGRGTLTLTRCSVFAELGTCVRWEGDVTLDRCHLVGKTCVQWEAGAKLSIQQTALEGEHGVATAAQLGVTRAATFDHCSFLTGAAVVVNVATPTVTPIAVTARRCVFDSPHIVTAFHRPTFPRPDSPPTPGEMRATARKLVKWTDRENEYRTKTQFLSAAAPDKPPQPADLTQLKEWLTFFGAPAGTATAAEIRFAPRPAGRTSRPPVSEVPADVGASALK